MKKGSVNHWMQQQGERLLSRPSYAFMLITLFAVTPFLTWIAVSIIAFITLRKGPDIGAQALGVGLLAFSVSTFFSSGLSLSSVLIVLLTFVPCFLAAALLQLRPDWPFVFSCVVGGATAFILCCHWLPPQFLLDEYQTLHALVQDFQHQGVHLTTWLTEPEQAIAYLLGMQTLSFVLSAITALMIARAFQARLFYPTGFKKELLSFQAYAFMCIPLLLIFIGLYMHVPLAISLLPTWLLYFVAAGYSTLVCLFSTRRIILTVMVLFTAAVLLPRIFLPLIAGVGVLDSLFHFRKRLSKNTSNHQNHS